MILCYQKLTKEIPPSPSWVSIKKFERDLIGLMQSGYKFVYLDDYDPNDPKQAVLTFDGVYKNAIEDGVKIIAGLKLPWELFIIGNYIGKNNDFAYPEPKADFADKNWLWLATKSAGARIQWHSKSNIITPNNIHDELDASGLFHAQQPTFFKWFAYPDGTFQDWMIPEVKQKFAGAVACENGNSDKYTLKRIIVTEDTQI
jgi:hypothetical protein